MSSHCVRCRKIQKINPRVSHTSNDKTMISSKCAVCDGNKSRFVKKQAKGILSTLGLKTTLNKIPLLGYILF